MASPLVSIECRWNAESACFDLQDPTDLDRLCMDIRACFPHLPKQYTKDGPSYRLTYLDDDGEEIELESTSDLRDATAQATARSPAILQVFVRPPTHMARSGMIEGEWENVRTQPEADSPTIAPAAAPVAEPTPLVVDAPAAAAPVTAPVAVVEVSKAEEQKSAEQPITPFESSPPVTVAPTTADPIVPAAAPAAAAAPAPTTVPTGSPSSGWSVFNLFGRSAAPAPAPDASVSQPLSQDSSSAPSLDNSAIIRSDSNREFYEMDDASQDPAESNAFTRAMDAQFASGVAKQNLWDSSELTSEVLSQVFTSMIVRTEEQLGLPPSTTPRPAGVLVRQPHQAMLSSLEGLDPAEFRGLIDQFATICMSHVVRKEARRREEEEARLAAAVAALEAKRQAEEAARAAAERAEQARLAELARAESERVAAAAAAAAEEDRLRKVAALEARRESLRQAQEAEQAQLEQMALKMAQLKAEQARVAEEAAEAEREQRELELEAAVPVQARLAPVEPAAGLASPPSPVAQPRSPVVDNESPAIVVPMVPVPVASPIAAPAQSAANRFNSAMSELRAMGFTDDALNTYMLQKTNLDMGQTIDWLMADAATGGALKNELQALVR